MSKSSQKLSLIMAMMCFLIATVSFYYLHTSHPVIRGLTLAPFTEFDFGTMRQNTSSSLRFELKNNYDDILKIRDVLTQCGCTEANVSTKLLAPGEISDLRITFDSGIARDDIDVSTEIIFSVEGIDGFLSLPITCRAKIEPDYLVVPERIVIDKQTSELQVSVKPNTTANLHVKSTRCDREFFTSDVKDIENGLTTILLKFHPEKYTEGRTPGSLTISTDSANQPIITLPIRFSQ